MAARLLLIAAGLAALFLGAAWWVLESGGVAVIETQRPGGGLRKTRVWFVRARGEIWLEAGRPENPWLLDVQRAPRLALRAAGFEGAFRAVPVPGGEARAQIRALMREKYGLRDQLLGCFAGLSQSVAVRLRAAEPARGIRPGLDRRRART